MDRPPSGVISFIKSHTSKITGLICNHLHGSVGFIEYHNDKTDIHAPTCVHILWHTHERKQACIQTDGRWWETDRQTDRQTEDIGSCISSCQLHRVISGRTMHAGELPSQLLLYSGFCSKLLYSVLRISSANKLLCFFVLGLLYDSLDLVLECRQSWIINSCFRFTLEQLHKACRWKHSTVWFWDLSASSVKFMNVGYLFH